MLQFLIRKYRLDYDRLLAQLHEYYHPQWWTFKQNRSGKRLEAHRRPNAIIPDPYLDYRVKREVERNNPHDKHGDYTVPSSSSSSSLSSSSSSSSPTVTYRRHRTYNREDIPPIIRKHL